MFSRQTVGRMRGHRSVIVVALVVLISAGALSALERNPDRVAELPALWVASHQGSLPGHLGDIAAYPVEYRAAILSALPRELYMSVVRQNIVDVLAARHDLSNVQRSYLEGLWRELGTKEGVARFSDADAARTECELQQRLFSKALIFDIGDNHLGRYSGATYGLSAVGVQMTEFVRSVAMAVLPTASARLKMCNCNKTYPICDCGSDVECQDVACTPPTGNICKEPYVGCLFTHAQPCNGWCPSSPPPPGPNR